MSDQRDEQAAVRVVEANRAQMRLVPVDLESLLPEIIRLGRYGRSWNAWT